MKYCPAAITLLLSPMISKLSIFAIVMILSGFLVSCASERTVTKTKVRKDAWGNEDTFSIGEDEKGNLVAKSDRRSSFEGKSSHLAGNRDFSGNDYTKKSYRKKRWGGNTVFNRKQFAGNTDASRYKQEPWFLKKQANASDKTASVANKEYSINPFRTGEATEQSNASIARTADAETTIRRSVFKKPSITDWKDQQTLSVSDTNSRLGR